MKITILGATGGTGTHLVRQALERGHSVTAVVRDPSRLDVEPTPGLEIAVARELTAAALEPAVTGRDAVLSALGIRGNAPTDVCEHGARSAMEAMHASGVSRLLVVSASGAYSGPGDDPFTRWLVKPILGRALKNAFDDMRRMETAVRADTLDWTIVRPPRLTDGPRTGRYRTRTNRNVLGGFRVSRADVADCMLTLLDRPASIHTVVSMG
ncbi:NAD(P)-dependent oxidoreductase [Thermomonospora umbrina]|uniref:Putative NADH-flavin reductase n=1 Tax=Thermomonospora umbrina TaxID=111806 RepID=A0A3D9SN44_9ACTN|nr:NAD(P)-binding oxidoreductase [Thermomonospora umbrina]REE97147.1 putative NADH-flavin reductase [Thermomonospora umbrina]